MDFGRISYLNFFIDDNCNNEEIEIPQNCYECDYYWDDAGTIGVGDPRCRTGVLGSMVNPCQDDQPFCVTERIAEWTHRGKQEHRIRRYCSAKVNQVIKLFKKYNISTLCYITCFSGLSSIRIQ